jgi:hypothetical protein
MDRDDPPLSDLSFDRLVAAIEQVHVEMAARASRAVNGSLTLRNWFIGCYIAEYEQRGADRARYGEGLLDHLAARLVRAGVARVPTTGPVIRVPGPDSLPAAPVASQPRRPPP